MDYLFITLLGAVCGSFVTVLVYRIPRDIPLGLTKKVRSECPTCKKQIPWYLNIPIFAYIFLGGKTACCKKKIGIQYFLIELITMLGFVATYYVLRHSVIVPLDDLYFKFELAKMLLFVIALVATTFIDIEFRIIPDRFSLGGWVLALVAAFIWAKPEWQSALWGGLMGFGFFFGMSYFYEKVRKIDGLGMGDVKIMGWFGTWVGLEGFVYVILIASISGLLVGLFAMRGSQKGMKTAIPFGPFLVVGAYVTWVLESLAYIRLGSF